MADLVGTATIRVTADTTAARTAILGLQRLSPVRITARVDAPTTGITAATTALRGLREEADDTSRALTQLSTRTVVAAAALRLLGTQARRLRDDIDRLDGSIRRLGAGITGLPSTLGTVSSAARGAGTAMAGAARAALLLAPALIPVAAQALPIAASVGAATVAVGAFAAAAAGQVSALTEAAEAEKKYAKAVREHGAGSKEAGQAQLAYARTVADMPAPTRRAAAALASMKDQYQEWSDSLAGDTMPVATKAFQTFGSLFPKLTPMVQGASGQLDRFVTIAAGGIASPGFDRFMESVAEFSTGVLDRANDGLVQFVTNINTGQVSGGVAAFMEYARENGPLVRDTLATLGEAVGNVLEAAANAGPGLLTLVNALAGLVAAVPPEVLTTMLQLAVAIKAVSLAAAGAAAVSGRVAAIGAAVTAMGAASSTASGRVARVTAAIGALSRAAKIGLAGTGIGLLVIGLAKLADIGKSAPPDVDRLTTSLGRLGSSGKVSGEAATAFGDDLENLYDKVRNITDPSFVDQVQNGFVKIFTLGQVDSTASKEAQAALDAIDDSLTNLVQGGKITEAGAALDILAQKYSGNADEQAKFRAEMDEYNDALDAHRAELEIAARAMGTFGQQAQDTSAKLAAQKVNADGLREAIVALNDVNRSAHDAQTRFGESVDALSESFKENGATLSANTEAGRANRDAMSAAAKARDELVSSGVAAGESLASMTGKSDQLRASMLKLATDAFDGNKAKAQEYINTLLGTPSEITTLVKAERADAITGLQQVQAEITKTPDSKSVTVSTLNGAAIKALEDVGLKTRQLPDGRTEVYTANGQSIGAIDRVSRALSNLDGDTAHTYTTHTITTRYLIQGATGEVRNRQRLRPGHYAKGGRVGHYASGGPVRGYPGGGPIIGPGTGTSDDVPIMASNGEYVINAASTRKHLPLVEAINDDRLGSSSSGVRTAAAIGSGGLAQAIVSMMRSTMNTAAERARAMAVSTVATLSRDIGRGLVAGLQAAAPKVAAAAKKVTGSASVAAGPSAGRAAGSTPKTGFAAAVSELQRLVDTGRWSRKGSMLFEDISFQGMSKNFAAQQMRVADGFWAAVNEIKKAVKSGQRVFEDMTYKGMSANVQRFHDVIAQLWKGNPYGRNFGDFGNFGAYGRYGKYAGGGLITGPGSGTSDSIPLFASNREYIVNARQTARNLPLLNAINSGQLTARGRTGAASVPLGDTNITVVVQNHGVIGSQMQMQDWLAKSLDNLSRTGRLPASLRKAVAA
ncbi:hypothetical protein ACFUN7_24160 [Streptomyces sp. NPDC057236]|uniref:hypothetical protein n=1 Tax=Streptomyces sp. NPDC057236 TaxID=3346059 RepID=UPI00362E82F1